MLHSSSSAQTTRSVARRWNEALLEAIRNDFARPTVHARNLFHTAIALYDAWAAFDDRAAPYLLGHRVGGYSCGFAGIKKPVDVQTAREEAISYAAYRLLVHRFAVSPGARGSLNSFRSLMSGLGYDLTYTSTDYSEGSPAALGNYIARCLIGFGLRDGSNEKNGYATVAYRPVNPPLLPTQSGNPDLLDANRWQSLSLQVFIDQAGHLIAGSTPSFLSPEWGQVSPFSLREEDLTRYERDGHVYWVYHDPGAPPYIEEGGGGTSDAYLWNFALVSLWSAHLDPSDGVLWDISPGAIGNNATLPETAAALRNFFDAEGGGDISAGRGLNPRTGLLYIPEIVPRGDYARVLAEFWADGPDSETPPGHWFVLLNYINDQPGLERLLRGEGRLLGALEWDVKAYFTLGGAMHDTAITAWGIKGWYDYIRPISALRAMADRGQSSDPARPNYAPDGMPLHAGFIEMIGGDDPLAGDAGEHVGKIKLKAWRGPDYIADAENDVAGVGWIRAENWWPYQRPSFVTPPFAGYVSGHSTYSRAAAEVLTLLTGDEYFPGGLGAFRAAKDEFLMFEEGPSVDVMLQWATYRDASDQCSLSRIWGGIHPPVDDIPGRLVGAKIGQSAFVFAERYFAGQVSDLAQEAAISGDVDVRVYPNPLRGGQSLRVLFDRPLANAEVVAEVYDILGQLVYRQAIMSGDEIEVQRAKLASGLYFLRLQGEGWETIHKAVIIK
jgi:hypothetical protein